MPTAKDTVETIEVETGTKPTGAVIWMHGLGADGHDFEPIVPQLVQRGERALRFVFPNAPVRPVTINGGYAMRAWYDISGLDRNSAQDEKGVRASDALVRDLIKRENGRGIATERIALAGFSQGGAMALYTGTRYPEKLAGIMALSCYMLLAKNFETERSAANRATPIFMAHGRMDNVVHPQLGEDSRQLLEKTGYAVEWHTYPMPHAVSPEEITDIAAWLKRVLP
jgi:phospholipase/carboxylesterase